MAGFLGLPRPVLAIKGGLCSSCLKATANLSKCGNCKRVSYCSAACQKADWKNGHKALCPILVDINDIDKLPNANKTFTWEQYRAAMMMRINAFRAHEPRQTINDERLLQYQPHCSTCRRNPFQLGDLKLILCPNCRIVAQCSSCGPSAEHTSLCPQFQEVRKSELFAIAHFLETAEASLQMPTQLPRKTYLPLSTASNWYEYFTEISDKQMVKGLLSETLQPLSENEEMASALTAATDNSTMMLTILAALEAVLPSVGEKKELNLHFVGATGKELEVLMLFEELLHLLPALENLHCVFVGLQLPKPMGDGILALDCCPECLKTRRTRSIEMWKGAYEEYVKTEEYQKPDMAVAFHTGFSQEFQEEWRPAIRHLITAGHATVFTSFNEKEMKEEMWLLHQDGGEFVRKGEKNIWMSLRPLLEVAEEEENAVYYNNQFWFILKGKGAKL